MNKLVLLAFIGFLSYSCSNDDDTSPEDAACPDITVINISDIFATSATVTISSPVDNSEFEYGLDGFTLGEGIRVITNGSSIAISSLEAGTAYNIYARSLCAVNASAYQGPFTFNTAILPACIAPRQFTGSASSVPGIVILSWSSEGETAWRLEYGVSGYNLGTGQEIFTGDTLIEIDALQTGVIYDFYLQADCGADGLSSFVGPLTLAPN